MVDLDALEAAGIADARRRAPLISYLDGLGFTAEEMVDAERRGRLFGLAGDHLQASGPAIHSLRTAAGELGLSVADVERAWAALGLTVAGVDVVALSQADVEGLRTWSEMRAVLGEEAATGLLRVIGSALARISEAESSMIRATSPDIQIDLTHDELTTAMAYHTAASYIPRLGALMDAAHRHHLMSTRTYFEHVIRDGSTTVECGVGFADLSDFTALTQMLTTVELTDLLNGFSSAAADVVHAAGGRVVKFIGDAVMWVATTPHLLATAAVELVEHPKARQAHVRVRAGLDFGSVLAINGDYFGSSVNRAARLVQAAEPGQVLVSAALRDALPDWPASGPRELKLEGFDQPVPAFALTPGKTGQSVSDNLG
ncbi:adenylate/guanylate cyclase domain-containing protein [Mycolicibacterium goodii]|uniref:Adenylate/guanylate cyclase domain-containing protein n=1 Tax=Mycolicibacterium goodii TaxID=134601 RepID=A0ABS6HMX9_MYCGD|nr:adenylate/guanylate cyclase domain-containing protein [Mycolicibacterium goodii]MBU8823980.1 adenylate/guanylate cyclase domain-containing protein [Mycolicibacterium goodii]MBU8836625.1 adenylate/guanylate cyclase domain-containing protein [Mycolicibacterium goodii]